VVNGGRFPQFLACEGKVGRRSRKTLEVAIEGGAVGGCSPHTPAHTPAHPLPALHPRLPPLADDRRAGVECGPVGVIFVRKP